MSDRVIEYIARILVGAGITYVAKLIGLKSASVVIGVVGVVAHEQLDAPVTAALKRTFG